MKAHELYELIIKDPTVKQVFRELGERLGFGLVLNGRKAGNFNALYVKLRFEAANIEHRVAHQLGRQPQGAMLVSDLVPGTTLGGVMIEATKPPDDRYLYLKSNTAPVTVALLVW
jgi:hypothetical protein